MLRIASPEDPRALPYTQVRERDLAHRHARFIIEGERVLELALSASRFRVESVLLGENRVAPMAEAITRLEARGIDVLVASQAVLDAIVGFHIHRGVLAIGLREVGEERVDANALLARINAEAPERALVVAMCGVANHDNVGGIFRNAAAFGASAVLYDAATCDPLYRKAIRVSVGAALVVPFAECESDVALIATLEAHGFTPYAMSPRAIDDVSRTQFPPRAALVFGSEEPGLSAAVMERAKPLAIAMSGRIDSLNVATASGVAMHAWFSATRR